jgi:hypothetical protein
MNLCPSLLAALEETDQILLRNMAHSGWSQTSIVFGSLALIGVLAFAFVFVFRKRLLRKRKHHHHHHHHHTQEPATDTTPAAVTVTSKDGSGRRKKRRLRRAHRPVNPTLAQTHGLPPVRPEGTPPAGL